VESPHEETRQTRFELTSVASGEATPPTTEALPLYIILSIKFPLPSSEFRVKVLVSNRDSEA